VSPLELVDDRFEKLAAELRAGRPVAPEPLRQRVRALEPPSRRSFELSVPWRRLVPAVALAGLATALGVAGVVGIVHGSSAPRREALAPQTQKSTEHQKLIAPATNRFGFADKAAPSPSADRLQQYDAALRIRVANQEELSKRTQDAYRLTRRLGGYVAWANYSTPINRGDSEVLVQIPIGRVQAAIAAFSGYGTLIGQRIRLKDLQQRVDTLGARINRLRAEIATLQRNGSNPGRLQRDRALLARLLRARSSTVNRAQMASVALAMVVGKKPAAAPAGRFDRTVGDAGSVLARELEILVYALVVAGPLLLLGLMGAAAARGARRRSDRRLLERA
jgi:hypothetical protein